MKINLLLIVALISGLVLFGCLGSSTGSVSPNAIWNYTTGGSVTSSPAVSNRLVYFGSEDNNVYAINASNGAEIWIYPTKGSVDSSPVVTNGTLYIGSDDDNLYALST